jgi:hypothetical protein
MNLTAEVAAAATSNYSVIICLWLREKKFN